MNFRSAPARLFASCAVLALLGGCASTETTPKNTLTQNDIRSGSGEIDASDAETAIQVSKMFRQEKRHDDAIAVLMRASVTNAEDGRIYAELGKVLIERGSPKEALAFLNRAVALGTEDWTIYSAAGVAYDQMSEHRQAQENYNMALLYSPEQPSVLSNLALSHAMVGDLNEAETQMRRAADQPGATEVIRLNLALIVGLQGRFDEAQAIAQTELPAAFAARNIDQLRAMLTQPNRWQDMKALKNASARSTSTAKDVPSTTH